MIFTLYTIIQEMLTRNAKRKLESSTPKDILLDNIDIETGLYKVEIDFDDASTQWKTNKKSIGNGSYKYICEKKLSTNRNCKKDACSGSPYCSMHRKEMCRKRLIVADMV